MPVTESVSSFSGFSDVYPSCKTLEHELARLFEKCDNISFKEATKRLRTAVENSISAVENHGSKRKVSEFRIGKTCVMSQLERTFNPIQPLTWGTIGRTNMKWGTHKKDNYDGLIAVGCVTNELIPKVIMEANTAIRMDHQLYALVMTQSLVHHYMVQEPDGKLRNTSSDIGYCSEEETEHTGSIIYIAYKLESEKISEVIKEKEQVLVEEPEGAASSDLPDKASPSMQQREPKEDQTKEDSNMLYRLLRPNENRRDELCAKNPKSTTSVFDYVINGSSGTPSKYISTCGSLKAVNDFQSKSTDPGHGRIAIIQKDKLPSSVEIIDLRLQENRDPYIDEVEDTRSIGKFNNFAKKFEVVLLVGHVPRACFELCDN